MPPSLQSSPSHRHNPQSRMLPLSAASPTSKSSSPPSSSIASSPLCSSPGKPSPLSRSAASPRALWTPRGSRNPHGGVFRVWTLLRHSKALLILAALAVFWFLRPSSMDPGGNLGAFMDSSLAAALDLGTSIDASVFPPFPSRVPPREDGDSSFDTLETEFESESGSSIAGSTVTGTATSTVASTNTDMKTGTSRMQNGGLLSSYDPSLHPLISLSRTSSGTINASKPAVDVHLIFDVSSSATVGPQSKFLLDGLERSSYTNVVGMTFVNPQLFQVQIGERNVKGKPRPMVWMVDWGSMQRDCHRLERVLEKLQRKPNEYVLLIDYSGSTRQSRCEGYSFLDKNDPYVRLAKRSIVANRHYNHTSREIDMGYIAENTASVNSADHPVMKASLVVRERFVSAIRNATRNHNPMKSTRDTSVCFFWKLGDYSHYGFGRRDVSNVVERLGKAYNFDTLVDVVANDEEGLALGNMQLNYVNALLNCKIVVIAQRDEWEDHYRLYESLASGAMVLMDPMLAPPAGLKNKTNVLIYDSLESLERLILYGLERDSRRQSIARRGMELALGRYRSWHRVEELLFGHPLSQVDQPLVEPPPKMTRPQISLLNEKVDFPT